MNLLLESPDNIALLCSTLIDFNLCNIFIVISTKIEYEDILLLKNLAFINSNCILIPKKLESLDYIAIPKILESNLLISNVPVNAVKAYGVFNKVLSNGVILGALLNNSIQDLLSTTTKKLVEVNLVMQEGCLPDKESFKSLKSSNSIFVIKNCWCPIYLCTSGVLPEQIDIYCSDKCEKQEYISESISIECSYNASLIPIAIDERLLYKKFESDFNDNTSFYNLNVHEDFYNKTIAGNKQHNLKLFKSFLVKYIDGVQRCLFLGCKDCIITAFYTNAFGNIFLLFTFIGTVNINLFW
jgi:hypothetical protein